MKYKIGDIVQIKPDLKVGATYGNEDNDKTETFTYRMEEYKGKRVRVINIFNNNLYQVNSDPLHGYTDDMLQIPEDKPVIDEINEFERMIEIDELLDHMLELAPNQLIDNALERGDKKAFDNIVDNYNLNSNSRTF